MTGEITIHGKVLAIGGLKEKLLAAQRESMTKVLIPLKNKATYQELPASLKRHIKVEFVSDYQEVFMEVFGMIAKSGASFRELRGDCQDEGLAS